MAIAQLLVVLVFWLQGIPAIPAEMMWHVWIMRTNSVAAALNILIMLGAWVIHKRGTGRLMQTMFLYGVVIYVLAMGLLLSVVDQLVISSISPLIISIVIVGTLFYMPPKNAFFIFTLYFLCFRFIFTALTNNSGNTLTSNLTNGLVAGVVGFSLSVVNWQHFRRLKIQENTIAKQQELLQQMAYQDSLTEIPNRRWMDETMKNEVALVQRQQVKSCLVMLDVDDFKNINDNYGHPVGDMLLRDLARLLQENIYDNFTLARIGGEEFAFLARGTSAEQCAVFAERLRTKIAEHTFQLGNLEIKTTASFGVAILLGSEDTRNYYTNADHALYQAKRFGKNRVEIEHPEHSY